MSKIGENIKRVRLKKKMTLAEVGKAVGVNEATMHKYESGVVRNIPSDKIEKIAYYLGVSPTVLMGWHVNNHYADKEVQQLAQELYDNPNMRILMEASKNLSPQDAKIVLNLIHSLKEKENELDNNSEIDEFVE